MKFLCCFLILLFVVGVYPNCGCLKCNTDKLTVLSQPCSPVKLIYRTQSQCQQPQNLPYSLQVPIQQSAAPYGVRCYGYQVQPERITSPQSLSCPLLQDYDVQVQVPVNPRKSHNCLLGLVASPDRILLPGPPPCSPGAFGISSTRLVQQRLPLSSSPSIQFEPLQVPEEQSDSLYYLPGLRRSSGCGCARYDRNIFIPLKLPQSQQRYSRSFYSKSQRGIPVIKKSHHQIIYPSQSGLTVQDEVKYEYQTPSSSYNNVHTLRSPRQNLFNTIDYIQRKSKIPVSKPLSNSAQSSYHNFFLNPSTKTLSKTSSHTHIPNEYFKQNHRQRKDFPLEANKASNAFQKSPIKISLIIPQTDVNYKKYFYNSSNPNIHINNENKPIGKSRSRLVDHFSNSERNATTKKFSESSPLTKVIYKDPHRNAVIKRDIQNIRFSLSPDQKQITYIQQIFLKHGYSKPMFVINSKTIQFSNLNDLETNFGKETEISTNTADQIRGKRAINMKLLALKPENPPKFLRKHSKARNERVASSIPYQVQPNQIRKHNSNNNKKIPTHSHKKATQKQEFKRKKTNAKIKATFNKAKRVIKDWIFKPSKISKPLDPPVLQIPNYPDTVNKQWWMDEAEKDGALKRKTLNGLKSLRRNKRALRKRDQDILPYFVLPDDYNKVETYSKKRIIRKNDENAPPYFNLPEDNNKFSKLARKDGLKEKRRNPLDPFLEPFNFEHILHPTPMLHLLNAPIRCLNHIHKFGSHVNPVVSTVPKVMRVSREYLMELFRRFGKDAIRFGANFVKNLVGFGNLKGLPKLRHKRSTLEDEDESKWLTNNEQDLVGANKFELDKDGKQRSDENEQMIDEIISIIADILQNQKQLDDQKGVAGTNKLQPKIIKREDMDHKNPEGNEQMEELVQSILHMISDSFNEKVSVKEDLAQREKRDIYDKRNYRLKPSASAIKFKKYKRETKVTKNFKQDEAEQFLNESEGNTELKRFFRFSDRPTDFLSDKEGAANFTQPAVLKIKKRSTLHNSNKDLQKMLSGDVQRQMNQKSLNTMELGIDRQIIKENIAKVLQQVKRVRNYDILEDLEIYKNLLKLDSLKGDILSELMKHQFKEFSAMRIQFENLKTLISKKVIEKLYNQKYISSSNWIKMLITLQKFHCAVRCVNQDQKSHLQTDFLKTMIIVPFKTEQHILKNLKDTKKHEIEHLNDLVRDLSRMLNKENDKNIQKVAKILWMISNIQKLQKDSILELHKKIGNGLQVRKELKILFDLQRQLETYESKQKSLIENFKE